MGEKEILKFTWQAFAFAAGNFLVLVALLYWLLHKPLLRILRKRQEGIEDAHKATEEAAEKARQTQERYERKFAAIEEERDRLLTDARQKAEQARQELIGKARAEAERAVKNLQRDWERQRRDALDSLQDEIVELSLELARRALDQLADADIESKLNTRLERELDNLAANADERTRRDLFAAKGPVKVTSASPLERPQQARLEELIQALSDDTVELSFETDRDLVAGTRIEFSSQAIDASLADVLAAARERFAELASEPEEDERP